MGAILACAQTNAAADNVLEGLCRSGRMVVRIGQPAQVCMCAGHGHAEGLHNTAAVPEWLLACCRWQRHCRLSLLRAGLSETPELTRSAELHAGRMQLVCAELTLVLCVAASSPHWQPVS